MSASTPALLLLLPIVLGATIWAWMGRTHGLSPRRRLIALGLRLAIFTALILALSGMTWQRPITAQAVAFVADLSASTRSGQDAELRYIGRALHARPQDDRAAIVVFGQQASVEQPPAALSAFNRFESVVDEDYSNLDAGLSLGGALLPSTLRRRVLLLSDGRQNLGDAVAEARLLRAEGIRVDVVPVEANPGPEVRVDGVDVPANLHQGERFTLTVRVSSTVATTAGVQILADGQLVKSGTAAIQPGSGTLSYDLSAPPPGLHTYRAFIFPAEDTLSQNNRGSAYTSVSGPPQVLVVEGAPGFGKNVVAALQAAHIQTTTITGDLVPPDLATLQRYAAVVLVDVPADELGQPAMAALRQYVGDLGRGLVVLGGTNSFGVGNYGSTPLEEALPLRMDLPKRKDLPTAAVVLVIESLESEEKVNISKRAGEGVVGLLNPQDQVAVSDASSGLVVPLQYVTNKQAIDRVIDTMQPGDPISYAPYLQQAYDTLKGSKAQTKHIILLGDGDAQDDYKPLLAKITKAGIQVSTIETNAAAASEYQTMRDIARWGNGKYYPADNVNAIPQIFLKVARTVAHSSIIEQPFYPEQIAPSPILAGISGVPQLRGYVVTTPKPLSTIVLASPKSDPILAQWQYGLGRAVAWTSDSQGRWSADWLANPSTKGIWSAMVNWVLPPPQSTTLALTAGANAGSATLGVDILDGTPYRSITARVIHPDGTATTATLQPTAPNHYEAQVQAGAEGTYLFDVQAQIAAGHAGAGTVRTISGGLVVPYAPDYRESGVDPATLAAIAAAGGGQVLSGSDPGGAFADNAPPVEAPTPLQVPLLLLALLLLPFDVAARRLILGPEEWQAILAAIPWPWRRALQSGQGEPALAPLVTMREQRAQRRRQPGTPSGQPHDSGAGGSTAPGQLQPLSEVGRPRPGAGIAPDTVPSAISTPAAPAVETYRSEPVRETGRPVTPAPQQPPGADAAASSTSKLLEAKRRRRGG